MTAFPVKNSQVHVLKRDGSREPFDAAKIALAVQRCLRSLPDQSLSADSASDQIAKAVASVVTAKRADVTVERIQDMVESQLAAADRLTAALAYRLYRDEHRKLREQIDPADAALVRAQKVHFPTELQHFQFTDKYARYLTERQRRETFPEAVDRTLAFFRSQTAAVPEPLTEDEWGELRAAMLRQDAFPSMRVFQMAGPTLERCNSGAYNCSYIPIDRLSSWCELLYVLMQGCGAGFSVESEYVESLPRIRRQKSTGTPPLTFIVPDTTEGWCEALRIGLEAWFGGNDVEFDFTKIRPQGTVLKTKGGRASGPGPLRNLLAYARGKILARQGRRLRPIDAHDIACYCGDVVQVGGTRRAAEISLSDFDDELMRRAKFGNFYGTEPQRQMSNNSVAYNERPSATAFMEEWLSLAQSGSGERGVFNREGAQVQIPKRRRKADFGLNPCGEIYLRPREFCNLSIAIARPDDSIETLAKKVRLATIFGTLQSTLTKFQYLSDEWKRNCEEERLLGVDINGQMDCPLLAPALTGKKKDEGREQLLRELRRIAVQTNIEFAARLGINPSAAVTCVKPSGNSSVLFNCSPGMHPRFAHHYLRRVRVEAFAPMAKLLVSEGVPYQIATDGSYRFEFPIKAADDAIITGDLSAIQQLENWRLVKTNYTEHNPSITVFVGGDEWLTVGNWVYEHWDEVGGLSFLPRTDAVYQLAPYEAITPDEYDRRAAVFPAVDYAKLAYYERDDQTTSAQEFACAGGVCEVA